MKQPTKDTLREQLALAADEIISLRQRLSVFCDPDSPYMLKTLRHRGGWEAHSAAAQVLARMQAPRKWWHRLWDKCKAVLGRG